jgi:hypothetical protein
MSEKEQIIWIEEYKYCIVYGQIFTNPRGDAWDIFIINNYYIYIITLLPFFIEMLQYDWL